MQNTGRRFGNESAGARPRKGHCTRLRKNWSHGQSNFASRCAMLRMARLRPNCWLRRVNSGGHMTRALTSVGGPLHSADGPARRSTTGLRSPAPYGAGRRRAGVRRSIEGLRRRITNHCISNRNKVRIEIVVTYSKQTRGTNSNRNSFRGSSRRECARLSRKGGD
jgi:hypothetical protein